MSRYFFRSGTILTWFVMTMLIIVAVSCSGTSEDVKGYHVWEKVEITFTSRKTYENPYKDMKVWVDLRGPGFWFDPQKGTWISPDNPITSDASGRIILPPFPDKKARSETDWALKLILKQDTLPL